MGIRNRSRARRIVCAFGVNPPLASSAHNSIRSAPPRSAASAASTLSTAISILIFSLIAQPTESNPPSCPPFTLPPPPSLPFCDRLASFLVLTASLRASPTKEALHELASPQVPALDSVLRCCTRRVLAGLSPAGRTLHSRCNQRQSSVLAGGASRSRRCRQNHRPEGRAHRSHHILSRGAAHCISAGSGPASFGHPDFRQQAGAF